jgi:uncharacterized membrane protein YczE
LIPRLGEQGAAFVTVVVSLLGASAAISSVYSLWEVWPPLGTFLRSVVVGLVVGAASMLWPTPGLFVFAKLIVLGMAGLVVPLATHLEPSLYSLHEYSTRRW